MLSIQILSRTRENFLHTIFNYLSGGAYLLAGYFTDKTLFARPFQVLIRKRKPTQLVKVPTRKQTTFTVDTACILLFMCIGKRNCTGIHLKDINIR